MACGHSDLPPDHGYSWVILLSSAVLFILQSCSYSVLGVWLVEFREYFQTDMEALSWIVGLKWTMQGLGCFLISHSVKVYGSRVVAVAGSFLITVGYILSTFAISVPYMYATFGVTTGLGYGFYMACAIPLLHTYFEKRKSLAFGILTASLSLGTFCWPTLMAFLLRRYSFRLCLLLQAAIQLHAMVVAMLFTPISYYQRLERHRRRQCKKHYSLADAAPVKYVQLTESDAEKHDQCRNLPNVHATDLKAVTHNHVTKPGDTEKDSMLSPPENTHKSVTHSSSTIQTNESKSSQGNPWCSRFTVLLPLSNSAFVLYILGQFAIQGGHVAFYSFIPVRGVYMGASPQLAALLPALLGVAGGIGRVLAGVIGDRLPQRRLLLSAGSAMIAGVVTIVSALMPTFAPLIGCVLGFGFLSGGYIAFFFTAVGDILPAGQIAHGTGLVSLISVAGSCVTVPPITGLLVDATGNLVLAYIFFGVLIMIGGVLMVMSHISLKKQRMRKASVIEINVTPDDIS